MEEEKKTSNLKFILLFIFLIIVGTILWARFISTKGLKVKEYPVYSKNLTANYDGLKIVHFSDLLYGRTVNKNDMQKIVTKINELKPDILIFTGDLIDKDTIYKKELGDYLSKTLSLLDARLYKIAILGDYDEKKDDYEIIMKNAGFNVLNNSSLLVYDKGNTPIYIAGFPNDNIDLDATLNYLTEHENESFFKIFLIHEPDNMTKIKDYAPDLVLSGHSLGGQIKLPFVGAIIPKKGSQKYYHDYYEINQTKLYISSGIGTTNYSFRWFNKPSINLYRLYQKV